MIREKVKAKTCRDCGKTKAISSFYVKERRASATRYFSRCKPCFYMFIHRPGDKRKPIIVRGKRLSLADIRLRESARDAINNGVYRGTIKKPSKCSRCERKVPSHRIHGHHHDYLKKFDVTWLCDECHRKEDA